MARPLKDPVQGEKIDEVATVENFIPKPQAVKPEAAKIRRPFDGYPIKPKMVIGQTFNEKSKKYEDVGISATYVVAYGPTAQIRQDPSNQRKIKNYHSRSLRDYEANDNMIVVFDREIKTKDGIYYGAVVPQHYLRAQLIFKYDPNKDRISVDEDYLLFDGDQVSRLRQTFDQIMKPLKKAERDASFISGEAEADPGEAEPLTENEV